MKKNTIVTILKWRKIWLLTLALISCEHHPSTDPSPSPPLSSIQELNAQIFKEIKQHPKPNTLYIIDIYGNDCKPCKDALPILEDIQNIYAQQICIYKVNSHSNSIAKRVEQEGDGLSSFIPTFSFFIQGQLIEEITSGATPIKKWKEFMALLKTKSMLPILHDSATLKKLLIEFEILCQPIALKSYKKKKAIWDQRINHTTLSRLLTHIDTLSEATFRDRQAYVKQWREYWRKAEGPNFDQYAEEEVAKKKCRLKQLDTTTYFTIYQQALDEQI